MKKISNILSNKKIKNIFLKYNALDKSHTIDRNTLFRELEEIENGERILNYLQFHQVIRKSNNRYYFCEKSETNNQYRMRLLTLKISILSIIPICIIIVSCYNYDQPLSGDDNSTRKDESLCVSVNIGCHA